MIKYKHFIMLELNLELCLQTQKTPALTQQAKRQSQLKTKLLRFPTIRKV